MKAHLHTYLYQYRNMPVQDKNLFKLIWYYPAWMNTVQHRKSPLLDGMPWITFEAISFLRRVLKKKMNVFEYGSGGSSVFFSRRVKQVTSVEHDKDWFAMVQTSMQNREIENWKGIFALPERSHEHLSDSKPADYSTSDKKWAGHTFHKYAKAIDEFPDEHFDLVTVDGRSRPACIMHAVSKIKKGGYILVDNADRENYHPAIKEYISENFLTRVSAFGPTAYSLEFTKTLICQKKK